VTSAKPEPIETPHDESEKRDRAQAQAFITSALQGFYAYAYDARSHMPEGLDFTDFTEAIDALRTFARARPDWTLEILEEATKAAGEVKP
jgi:hypothetical protein